MREDEQMSDHGGGWSDQDEAQAAYEGLPAWHPSLFVDVLRAALEVSADAGMLAAALVTPESAEQWGDFTRARALFASGLKISMTPVWATGAPDVAYVRLVETDQHVVDDAGGVPATVHVTLVWRPEIAVVPGSRWRVHHIGDRVDLDLFPRAADGFRPRPPSHP